MSGILRGDAVDELEASLYTILYDAQWEVAGDVDWLLVIRDEIITDCLPIVMLDLVGS